MHKPADEEKKLDKRLELFLVLFFFVNLLFIGLFIYDDYGISWDEPKQRELGMINFNYIFQKNDSLLSYENRQYGPAFELPLIFVEKKLNLNDTREIFLIRHLITFLVFYIGVVFFYLLCKRYFKGWKISLIGSLFLVLSPRIFSDAFYNSKDLVFLSFFIISIYTLFVFLEKKNFLSAFFHALTCAILIDIRVLGILVPFFTFIFLFYDFLKNKDERKKIFIVFSFYLILLVVITIAFWPWLWKNPLNLFASLKNMSKYNWNGTMLYLGNYIESVNLPWHYIPFWILITTPVIYILGFILGIFSHLLNLFNKKKKKILISYKQLTILLWLFIPLLLVIIAKSIVYDGWRHLFFIYPSFLIISLGGFLFLFNFVKSFKNKKVKITLFVIFFSVILIFLFNIAFFMIKYHPNQNFYFNALAGNSEEIKNNFEMDYWGLSYRQALEFILKNDNKTVITLASENLPGIFNSYILKTEERKRLKYVTTLKEADYLVTNYRWHKEDYPYKEYYSVKINGLKIMNVYKLIN